MKRTKGENINGWLIINKHEDIGSTNVVSKTRHLLNANKNGHCGTLDPFATGVLPIAFGEATKLIEYVMDGLKEYEFIIQFGSSTNTDDLTGEVVATTDNVPTKEQILNIMPEFMGKIEQIPSSFSAIKIDGKRAYDLARAGIEVVIPKREVEIYSLTLLEMLPNNQAHMKVECSKGTYVRTLAKDLALKLGSLGHLVMLKRTRCGVFGIEDAILLDSLKGIDYKSVLLDIKTPLRDIADVAITQEDATKLKHGQGLSPQSYNVKGICFATCDDKLVAIIENDGRKIKPVKVFNL